MHRLIHNYLFHAFVLLSVSVFVLIASILFVFMNRIPPETDTDFFILDKHETTINYPEEIVVPEKYIKRILNEDSGVWEKASIDGYQFEVKAGIINREGDTQKYQIRILVNNQIDNIIGPITISYGDKWIGLITVHPRYFGENQRIDIFLDKYTDQEPYLSLLSKII